MNWKDVIVGGFEVQRSNHGGLTGMLKLQYSNHGGGSPMAAEHAAKRMLNKGVKDPRKSQTTSVSLSHSVGPHQGTTNCRVGVHIAKDAALQLALFT